jgi:hypothetical protein
LTGVGNYQVIAADDPDLVIKARRYIAGKVPFWIEAGPSYRHRKALVDMLHNWALGNWGRRGGFWRYLADLSFRGKIITVWVLASHDAHYTWRSEITDERVTIFFDPPLAHGGR